MSRFSISVFLGIGCGLAGCHIAFSSDGSKSSTDAKSDAVSDAIVVDAQDAFVDANAVPPNYVFITSDVFPGSFGGIGLANAACEQAAAGKLPGTFIALLGTTGTDYNAFDLLQNSRGWIRSDGAIVANSAIDFTNGNLRNAIVLDENKMRPEATQIWTGLDATGSPTANDCAAFSTTTGISTIGDTSAAATTLTVGQAACTASTHLLCISFGSPTMPSPLPRQGRKRIFLSTTTFTGKVGLAAFDAKCADEAEVPLGSRNFVALLPTISKSAMERAGILSADFFTRVDGSPVGSLEKKTANVPQSTC